MPATMPWCQEQCWCWQWCCNDETMVLTATSDVMLIVYYVKYQNGTSSYLLNATFVSVDTSNATNTMNTHDIMPVTGWSILTRMPLVPWFHVSSDDKCLHHDQIYSYLSIAVIVPANASKGTLILILAMMPWHLCHGCSNDGDIMLIIYMSHITVE